MAKVTTKSVGTTFVLELNEAEAQYVHAALLKTDPAHLDDDTVYDELDDALRSSDVGCDLTAAR